MRDSSFSLVPSLFPPSPPYRHEFNARKAFDWRVLDARGVAVASSRTRAGARAAVSALYAGVAR